MQFLPCDKSRADRPTWPRHSISCSPPAYQRTHQPTAKLGLNLRGLRTETLIVLKQFTGKTVGQC